MNDQMKKWAAQSKAVIAQEKKEIKTKEKSIEQNPEEILFQKQLQESFTKARNIITNCQNHIANLTTIIYLQSKGTELNQDHQAIVDKIIEREDDKNATIN